MKKFNLLTTGLVIAILSACSRHHNHRVIKQSDNSSTVRIEYEGQVLFNHDTTGISSISPSGFVKYEKDGQSFMAKNKRGHIIYEINGDYERDHLNADEQEQLTTVLHQLARYGHNVR